MYYMKEVCMSVLLLLGTYLATIDLHIRETEDFTRESFQPFPHWTSSVSENLPNTIVPKLLAC